MSQHPKLSNESTRYDAARVAQLQPIEKASERLRLPPSRARKLGAILSALELQIECRRSHLRPDAVGLQLVPGPEDGAGAVEHERGYRQDVVFHWCQDLKMELGNAGLRQPVYHEHGLRYAREFLAQLTRTVGSRGRAVEARLLTIDER